jgi:hypothetical protein
MAIQLKGNDHVEEAYAHAISELGYERYRRADHEECLRYRFDYGLRSR